MFSSPLHPGPRPPASRLSSGGATATATSENRKPGGRPGTLPETPDVPPAPTVPPPALSGRENLFQKVEFHPLSVNLFLPWPPSSKTRRLAEVGERLAKLLVENPNLPSRPPLNLSLDRVPAEAHQLLPRLGVFHGGALENILLWGHRPGLGGRSSASHGSWPSAPTPPPGRPGARSWWPPPSSSPKPSGARPYLKFHPTMATAGPTMTCRASYTIWMMSIPIRPGPLLTVQQLPQPPGRREPGPGFPDRLRRFIRRQGQQVP